MVSPTSKLFAGTRESVFFIMSVTFRSTSDVSDAPSQQSQNDYVANNVGTEEYIGDIEPVTPKNIDGVMLSALGITDTTDNLPDGDQANLKEVSEYVKGIVEKKGLNPTKAVYERVLRETLEELDIDKDTEPSVVLDRIGGLTKAYRDLMFIRDAGERRRLFMKMAKMEDSKSMDEVVYRAMEERKIWQ